jgi:hypothetical protein
MDGSLGFVSLVFTKESMTIRFHKVSKSKTQTIVYQTLVQKPDPSKVLLFESLQRRISAAAEEIRN